MLRHAGLPLYLRRERNRFARLIWCNARSKRIVVPSTHTKHALLTEFPSLAPESITVSYSPLRKGIDAEEVVKRTPCVLREHGLESRKFFLVVNAGRWIKNAYRALTALDAFFQARAEVEHKAIFLGVRPGQRLPHHARSRQRFVFHDYVSDETLQMLYRSAFALIYATLNEGFGYPPLEAMRWGTPVICSAVTSLPEVCDSGVLYCNPLHVHEITNRISQLVFEPGRWDDYSRRGRERYQEVAELQRASLDRICGLILGRA